MHQEIELILSLAGMILSEFIDRVVLINWQLNERITSPAIQFFPDSSTYSWVIRLSWMHEDMVNNLKRMYPVDELIVLLAGDLVAGKESLRDTFLSQALSKYPAPKHQSTFAD